ARTKLSSCAGERRYSSNSDRSALKPVVLMLATLLATTSICRSSVICRESPTRSIFSIGGSPLDRSEAGSPKPVVRIRRKPLGSPKPAGHASYSAKAVPSREIPGLQGVRRFLGCEAGGRKVLLTMFARQIFPTWVRTGKVPLTITTLALQL